MTGTGAKQQQAPVGRATLRRRDVGRERGDLWKMGISAPRPQGCGVMSRQRGAHGTGLLVAWRS